MQPSKFVRARIELDEVSQLRADQRRAPADEIRRRKILNMARDVFPNSALLGTVPARARGPYS